MINMNLYKINIEGMDGLRDEPFLCKGWARKRRFLQKYTDLTFRISAVKVHRFGSL
jgi:hypothetical protein